MGILRLGIAMLTTPIGWFIMGIAAIAGGAYLIYKNWDGISKWFSELWDAPSKALSKFWDDAVAKIKSLTDLLPDWMKDSANMTASISTTANPSGMNQWALAGGATIGERIMTSPRPIAKAGGTTNINAHITVNQQPGQSGTDVAKAITTELDKRERNAAAAYRAQYGDRP
ncbi:hypothetical protein [Aeromonas sobria]|uniref:hypothetical protein n=1 Tax=Aeromonas sobria TaxID=646 RepID=UPI001119CF98|nr:hypothetical protein [Aeromonas sobria]